MPVLNAGVEIREATATAEDIVARKEEICFWNCR